MFSEGFHFDLAYFLQFVLRPSPALLHGLWITVGAAIAAQLIGLVLGTLLALAGLSRHVALGAFNQAYIWFFRGTPVLVQLMMVYFGLPYLIGFDLFPFEMGRGPLVMEGALVAGILTFGLHEAALMSEIARAGISSVDRGQVEAAKSLGMWPILTFRRIVLPQAVKVIVPPLGNQFNNMLKTTSLLSVIGVGELFRAADEMQAASFKTFEVYLGISVYYLALTAAWTILQKLIERRLSRNDRTDARRTRNLKLPEELPR